MENTEWAPDFGPLQMNYATGATIIGARGFLIAYNVNLASKDAGLASDIAKSIREKGHATEKNSSGLEAVKAIGWFMQEFGCAQVSTNISDITKASLHQVFERVKAEAALRGVAVNGSELIGLVPLKCVLAAGEYYAQKAGLKLLNEGEKIDLAVSELGLNSVKSFQVQNRILEYLIFGMQK